MCAATAAAGQASLSIDNTQALIGDQLELTLQVNAPSSMEWANPDAVPADTSGAIEVVRTGDVQTSAQGGYTQHVKSWTIAVFDTGVVRVPPLQVILRSSLGADTQYTNDIPLVISGVVDSLGMAPNKPIIREPAKLSDYLPYIAGVVGFCLLAWAIYWWTQRKPAAQEVVEIRDEKTPHEIALAQLDALEREKLWQQGQVKEYHSRLHYIMREYLERRFYIPALESTTGEIIRQLKDIRLDDNLVQQVRDVMEAEDLIKFAKAEPPVDVHAQYLGFARELVMKTRIQPQSEGGDV